MLGWYVCWGGFDEFVFLLFIGSDVVVSTGVYTVVFLVVTYDEVPVEVSYNGYE